MYQITFYFLLLLLTVSSLCNPGDQGRGDIHLQLRSLGEPDLNPDGTLPGALIRLPLERGMTASALFTQHAKMTTVVIYFDPYSDPYWTEEQEICLSWVMGLPLTNSTDHECNFSEATKCISSLPIDPCQQTIRAPPGDCEKNLELVSGTPQLFSYDGSVSGV